MNKIIPFLLIVVLAFACSSNEEPENIIREQTYLLHRATSAAVSGTATVTEIGPGKLKITIRLKGASKAFPYPAHLHFGSIAEVGELAYRLNDVDSNTGISETIIDQVEIDNGQILDYSLLQEMNGSIKVHMNDTFFKHMVLAFGNVGKNENYLFDGVATCTGH